jgi:RTA1 like protein
MLPRSTTQRSQLVTTLFSSGLMGTFIVRAVGGNTSLGAENMRNLEPGGGVMMYGIILLLIGTVLVSATQRVHMALTKGPKFCSFQHRLSLWLLLESAIKVSHPDAGGTERGQEQGTATERELVLMLLGAGFTTLFIVIQSIYRTTHHHSGRLRDMVTGMRTTPHPGLLGRKPPLKGQSRRQVNTQRSHSIALVPP